MSSRHQSLGERSIHQIMLMNGHVSSLQVANDLQIPALTAYRGLCRLEANGLAERASRSDGTPGRPTSDFGPRLPSAVAAVSIDGSAMVAARVEPGLEVGELHEAAVPGGAEEVIASIGEAVQRVNSNKRSSVKTVAVAVNAIALGAGGISSSVLPWVDASWRESVGRASRLPVRFIFPPIAVAEFQKSESTDGRSMVYFHAGDGVSAHGVLMGKLHTGASGMAGELGHVTLSRHADAPLCGCGKRGCLEALCSGPAIVRRFLQQREQILGNNASRVPLVGRTRQTSALESTEDTGLRVRRPVAPRELHYTPIATSLDFKSLSRAASPAALEMIWAAWLQRDPFVRTLMAEVLDDLAWGLSLPLNLIDPDWVSVGGYVFSGRSAWLEELGRCLEPFLLHANRRDLPLRPARSDRKDLLRVTACCASFESAMASRVLSTTKARA